MEIVGAAGLHSPSELNRTHIYRRVKRYDELFAYADVGSLLNAPYPPRFAQQMAESDARTFLPRTYVAQHGGGLKELDEVASA